MKNIGIKISLYLNYFVFAILLNSVGIVILKSQKNYGVDEVQASILEAFKDMPIAIVSFFIASFLPRIGFKKAMLIGLGLVTLACISMYFGNSFDNAKILFATVGVSFALIKVSVYSLIGTVTENQKQHNALMSSIEGVFMIGIALAYFLFPAFNDESDPNSWLNVYWFLAALSLLSFAFLFFTKFEEPKTTSEQNFKDDFLQMFKLIAKTLTIVFVISVFLFVMIEQGILSWLPTFNTKVLHLPENISIMMASILAISLAVGRLIAGIVTQKINWIWVLTFCIIAAMLIVIFVLPKVVGLEVKSINSLTDIPLIGFAFPLIGLFIAPIYPLLNSIVLSALPKNLQSSMTGLIVIFSALGGTLGSRITGWLFKNQSPEKAFYFTLIPMFLLLISFFILKKITAKDEI
ncbi:MFS transporter [Flavobacterium sp. Fl-77]|uniref:MFS transporter n=1 Tax=Flavobacterium flavipigmentatum TaxID=2893884 RepID=A0AAJ2SER2_9FLAO|nr:MULTISPECIES: MFS transporter [unclassified Flavobacterium]MDX6181177.1 MFS transporter [Flavobacterium sp. Fl-33]MDX6184778.1 MFS transporter [Flavobacterium sp. Fl-77]UFH39875.1 MFS transporter [Flavobacterium sp. F-70]